MTLLDANDLAMLRADQALSFLDTCQIAPVVETAATGGELVESWPTYADAVACGFEPTGGRERRRGQGTILITDATLRLALGTTITARSRVKVTKIKGETLSTPLYFGVVGSPRQGKTALVVELEEVS